MIVSVTLNIVVTQSRLGEEVWSGQTTELVEVDTPADFINKLDDTVARVEQTEAQDWFQDQKIECSANVTIQCYTVLVP